MNNQITEVEELQNESQEMQSENNCDANEPLVEAVNAPISGKTKFTKKTIAIFAAAAVAIIAIALVILIPSKFERVKKDCCYKAWWSTKGKDYFEIDTYPNEDKFSRQYANMDSSVKMIVIGQGQKSTLEAIQMANEELGFGDYVYSEMMKTNALMGRQSEENDKYEVSWTYHPDEGLEVRYEKK